MNEIVDRLLKATPGFLAELFESSDGLDDASADVIATTIRTYEKHYERRLRELTELLGTPMQTENTHRENISRWYPESIRAACLGQRWKDHLPSSRTA